MGHGTSTISDCDKQSTVVGLLLTTLFDAWPTVVNSRPTLAYRSHSSSSFVYSAMGDWALRSAWGRISWLYQRVVFNIHDDFVFKFIVLCMCRSSYRSASWNFRYELLLFQRTNNGTYTSRSIHSRAPVFETTVSALDRRDETYAGRVPCCPLTSHFEHIPCVCIKVRIEIETDRQAEIHHAVALRLPPSSHRMLPPSESL